MPKPAKNIAAVIDIGSKDLRLKIAQRGKDSLKYLESLTYGLSLGRDTFDTGRISFEKIDKACEAIKNFLNVAAGYGIKNVADIRAAATTAVREAANREYIIDQIKIKTNVSVKIYDDMEEKRHIYRMMMRFLDDSCKTLALMVHNGSGVLGVSAVVDGRIPFVRNIRTGSLRISETFLGVQEYSGEFQLVIDEYLSTFTEILRGELPADITHFIASGHEMPAIAGLCGCPAGGIISRIPRGAFEKLYDMMRNNSPGRVSEELGVAPEQLDVLLPAVIIYHKLMNMTKCGEIVFPSVFLSDSLLFEALYPEESSRLTKGYNKNALASARVIAAKYCEAEAHYSLVEKFAAGIFDKMKKIHGMGVREKVLLQAAAILHDIGKFVNISNHHEHSYHIVRGCDIVGLSELENRIVASLCFYHSSAAPGMADGVYGGFRPSERVLVSKLAAILRLAEALDRSHRQKFGNISVSADGGGMTVTARTDENTDLERWAFDEKAAFFEDVFGIKAVFMKKRLV